MNIHYIDSADDIASSQLEGFFVGWEKQPTPDTLLRILRASAHIMIAIEGDRVVGFATAISDGILAAYVPLVEVLPEYQSHGIGRALVEGLLKKLEDIYMIDLVCEEEKEAFYEKFGFRKFPAMILRHYDKQVGNGKY